MRSKQEFCRVIKQLEQLMFTNISTIPAPLIDLNGSWTAGGPQTILITISSGALTVDMTAYHRPTAHGSIIDSSTITVTFPDDNTYTGKLLSPGTIHWSNDSSCNKIAAASTISSQPTCAPEHILQISYKSTLSPSNLNWAKEPDGSIPGLGGEFPFPPSEKEWQQVLSLNDEYDVDAIGVSGWVVNPEHSKADLPFTHPFGMDWEFQLAVDQPSDDPNKYTWPLSSGNQVAKNDPHQDDYDAFQAASQLGLPLTDSGLLGVEWDDGLVPTSFKDQVHTGDRVAVYGRWILDTGHTFNGIFRTEIHPPLLMAVGSIKPEVDGSQATRVLFTSRPYLVGQIFTTDTDQIHKDDAPEDGHFFKHMLNENKKLSSTEIEDVPIPFPNSTFIEAHPKIKTHPFQRAYLAHFVIRPPVLEQVTPPNSLHGPGGILGSLIPDSTYLAVSFHFTVRSGCSVRVTSSTANNAVDVLITLNSLQYTPPPLPERTEVVFKKDDLKKLNSNASPYYLDGELL
jgi:hypothetical protein